MSLNARALHAPGLGAAPVGQMANEPVAGDRGGDPGADAPDHKAPAASQIERRRDRDLLQHPRSLKKAVEPVTTHAAEIEGRRAVELQSAVHLPDRVNHKATPVGEIVVTVRLPLAPVPQIVGADHPEGSAHADRRASRPAHVQAKAGI